MHIPWAMRPGEVYVSKAAAPRMGRARFTLGGMSVESPRRVTKLIVTVRPARSLVIEESYWRGRFCRRPIRCGSVASIGSVSKIVVVDDGLRLKPEPGQEALRREPGADYIRVSDGQSARL